MVPYSQPDLSEGYKKLARLVKSPYLDADQIVGPENCGAINSTKDLVIVRDGIVEKIETLADTLHYLTGVITQSPDLTADQIFDHAINSPLCAGLSDQQFEAVRLGLNLYAEHRQQIQIVRAAYADDELYQASFHRQPKGEVQVICRPTIFYLLCLNTEDYTFAFYGRSFGDPTDQEMKRANRTGGFYFSTATTVALPTGEKNKIHLALENAHGCLSSDESSAVLNHEEQHSRWNLINRTDLEYRSKPVYLDIEDISKTEDSPTRKQQLLSFLRDIRSMALARVQDEFLAYLVNQKSPDEIASLLLCPEEENGLYDYFPFVQREEIKTGIWIEWQRADGWAEIESGVERVFTSEYRQLILRAADAALDFLKLGYSYERVMELFTFIPIDQWGKAALRFDKSTKSRQKEILMERRSKLGLGNLAQSLDSLLAEIARSNPKKAADLLSFHQGLESLNAQEMSGTRLIQVNTYLNFWDNDITELIFRRLGVVGDDTEWAVYINRVVDPLLTRAGAQQKNIKFETAAAGLSVMAAPKKHPLIASTYSLAFDRQAVKNLISSSVRASLFSKKAASIKQATQGLNTQLVELTTTLLKTPETIMTGGFLGLGKKKAINPEYLDVQAQIRRVKQLLSKYQ